MTARIVRAEVSAQPLDAAGLTALTDDDRAGAVVTFTGVVRNHDLGQPVDAIDYTSHPQADRIIAEIADDLAGREGVHAICLVHRIGHLEVGDLALVAVVAAEHRSQAFTTTADLVDEVKRRLPIWKKQLFSDGHSEWTGLP